MNTYNRVRIATAAYAVVLVFFVAFLIINLLQHFLNLSVLSPPIAVAFAVLIAVPLALAFTWERLTSVKVPNILEISLSEITVQPEIKLSVELEGTDATQLQQLKDSGIPEIQKNIEDAIKRGPFIELIKVNLGKGNSWWSTRLYLLAALTESYTEAKRILFEEEENSFVGIASPRDVRLALEKENANLGFSYRMAFSQVFMFPVTFTKPSDEAGQVMRNYVTQLDKYGGEKSNSVLVTTQFLEGCLQKNLTKPTVICTEEDSEASQPPPLLLHDIIKINEPFVALIDRLRPKKVLKLINRQKLAVQITLGIVDQQLK
jgi:hypothetical protein